MLFRSYHVDDNRFGPVVPTWTLDMMPFRNAMNDVFDLFIFDPWITSDSSATETDF